MDKYTFSASVASDGLRCEVTRLADKSEKRFYVAHIKDDAGLGRYSSFMHSLTDRQCDDMFKGK